MENSYGIGITNRYDLFCMDDDANDMESILSKKAKQQKKAAAKAATASANEKENKVAPAVIKPPQAAAPAKGTQQQNGQPPKSRPIKETQNIRSNSDKGPREGIKKWKRAFSLRNFCEFCCSIWQIRFHSGGKKSIGTIQFKVFIVSKVAIFSACVCVRKKKRKILVSWFWLCGFL